MSEIKGLKGIKKKKYLTWALILVLLFLAFLIGRSYQVNSELSNPNTTPSIKGHQQNGQTTWSTFTNTAHNFSIEYPSNWYIDTTDASTQFVLRKKGTKLSYIYFSYAPAKNPFVPEPNATMSQSLLVGSKPLAFTEYFTGIGQPTLAYANLRTTPLGGTLYNVIVSMDVNNTASNAMTIKKILASFKTLK